MTLEDLAYFINSYFVKIALLVCIFLCPSIICACVSGLSLLGVFIIEQITYEKTVNKWVEHSDKLFVVLSALILAIGYMI